MRFARKLINVKATPYPIEKLPNSCVIQGGGMNGKWISSHRPHNNAQGWVSPIGHLPSKQFTKWG